MPTLDDFNNIDHDAVLDAMSAKGLSVGWEYPGIASIEVTPTVQVWTGLHSYAYGDISVLNVEDNRWEPLEAGGEGDVPLDEYETDPELIAEAWATWVRNYREGLN